MEASALSKWRWVDWLRFFFYRHVRVKPRSVRTRRLCVLYLPLS